MAKKEIKTMDELLDALEDGLKVTDGYMDVVAAGKVGDADVFREMDISDEELEESGCEDAAEYCDCFSEEDVIVFDSDMGGGCNFRILDSVGVEDFDLYAEPKAVKAIQSVNMGDTGYVYGDEPVKVIKAGNIGQLLRYDDSGVVADMIKSGELERTDHGVAVRFPDGGEAVYVYGYDGVVVYED